MKVSKEARGYLMLVIVFLGIVAGYTVVTRAISGTNFPLAAVQSPSMEPNIPTGSLIFIQWVDGENVVVGPPTTGDVLVYYFPNEIIVDYFIFTVYDPTPWSHRAIQKTEINGTWYFLTKGDANAYPDQNALKPSTWVPDDRVIGRVIWHVPYLGYPFLWLRNGYLVAAIIVILLIIILLPMGKKKEKPSTQGEIVSEIKNLYKPP
jgi:signal peptidase